MFNVLLLGNPKLREVAITVGMPEMRNTIADLLHNMNSAMKAEGGRGLAAPQIGVPLRVFIVKADTQEGFIEYINPEIVSESDPVAFEGEGCLSVPGTFATTKRFNKVTLSWVDRDNIKYSKDFEGLDAFTVQHEVDHLNGKLYIDTLGTLKKQLTLSKHKKFMRYLR